MLPVRRYADWRPVAVRRVPAQWIGVALGALIAGPFALFVKQGGYFWMILGGFIAHRTATHLAERRMRGLRDDPEGGQFAVTLRLAREVGYGFDEGLVAFVDGWLVYSGRQCSFSVRRADVLGLFVEAKRHGFVFQGPAGRHAAFFVTAEPGRLDGAFKAWSEAQGVLGEAVYPPVLPNAEARTLHRSWFAVGFIAFALVFVDALIQSKRYERVLIGLLASAALPLAALYGSQAQRALARIASGLSYRRNRFARFLNIRPVHAAQASYRSSSIKARTRLRLKGATGTPLSTAGELDREANPQTLPKAMFDYVRENAFSSPSGRESPPEDVQPVWAPDADGVLRQDAKTQR